MRKNNFFEGIKFGLGFVFILSLLGLVYAVGFHIAEEILPGTFTGDYVFNGSVNITSGNDICITGGYCLNNSNKGIYNESMPDSISCDGVNDYIYYLDYETSTEYRYGSVYDSGGFVYYNKATGVKGSSGGAGTPNCPANIASVSKAYYFK